MAGTAPTARGHWPGRRSAILDWLVGDGRLLPDGPSLLRELCTRLVDQGLPLARGSFHLRMLHPQLFGIGFYWHAGAEDIRVFRAEHGVQSQAIFQQSPMRALFEGAAAVRQRLDLDDQELAFPLLHELRAEGLTDYLALPMVFSDGKIHGTTWSANRPGGFAAAELALIGDLLPVFGMLLEIHFARRITIDLLDTYVGHRAGERILDGQIIRGTGATIDAAIWYCDLRGFTALSERIGRDQLIDCLNDYFDAMAGPVKDQGGEILKFIGDAMLAIFPLADPDACDRALQAALAARTAMAGLNQRRRAAGDEALGFGIALHAGEVMYGNIGATDRLDFTVIGPAVNLASRIEGLCRTLDRDLLLSEAFIARCRARAYRSLGRHRLAGIDRPVEVFTVAEAA